jgi:hypothetical protein
MNAMVRASTWMAWLVAGATFMGVALAAGAGHAKRKVLMKEKQAYPEAPEDALKGVVRTNLDSPNPTKAQLDRKKKSIARVQELGLPWMEHLPVVEDAATIKPRTKQEVASRCLATVICAVKGETNDQTLAMKLAERYAAKDAFSPEERKFFLDPNPAPQDLANFGWRYECVHVFLWALGYLPALNPPNRIADVGREVGIVRDKGLEGFAKDATLRPLHEILDQADLYYRLHWAAIELRLKGKKHDVANEEIILERHRALNWLIRYMDQAWDEITTDT